MEFVSEEIKNLVINKSLEKYGITVSDIKKLKNASVNGVNWQENYTLTEAEYKNWFHSCIDTLQEKFPEMHPDMVKTKFLYEYASIYGLKTV